MLTKMPLKTKQKIERIRILRDVEVSPSDLQGFIMSGIISKYEESAHKQFKSILSKLHFDFDGNIGKLKKEICFTDDMSGQYPSQEEFSRLAHLFEPSNLEDRQSDLTSDLHESIETLDQVVTKLKSLIALGLLTTKSRAELLKILQSLSEAISGDVLTQCPEGLKDAFPGAQQTDPLQFLETYWGKYLQYYGASHDRLFQEQLRKWDEKLFTSVENRLNYLKRKKSKDFVPLYNIIKPKKTEAEQLVESKGMSRQDLQVATRLVSRATLKKHRDKMKALGKAQGH